MNSKFEKTISINASPDKVWEHLTDPYLMKKWMADEEMEIEINTNWLVGDPILITGFHHVKFENKGRVLKFEANKIIQYSHLSSISCLPDTIGNYTVITFALTAYAGQTLLTVEIENFPTESIYKHFGFYWRGTLEILKKNIEQQ
jgi:uncharacterized protein YndB with AHSA1/START domain